MALFFSGAVTSSPIKERHPLSDQSCQSLGLSLLSPDSSYVCYSSNTTGGSPCSCRRSPRLLSNGYYLLTEDSYSWDDEGNVSLTPDKTTVSYKENLVRVFRRRRRPRRSLASLLSDMTETCQSWLDQKVFGGVFNTAVTPESSWVEDSTNQEASWVEDSTNSPVTGASWLEDRTNPPVTGASWVKDRTSPPVTGASWVKDNMTTALDSSCSFTYDPTEIVPPPEKLAPPSEPRLLFQEEICTETCHSQGRFTQSLGGLSEVPPPSAFYTNSCCPPATIDKSGVITMKSILLLVFCVFIFAAVHSRCVWWSLAAALTTFMMLTSFMLVTKTGPMGRWRRAKTEDITSRNE